MGTDTISANEEAVLSYDEKVNLVLDRIAAKRDAYKDAANELMGTWVGNANPAYRLWMEELWNRLVLIDQTIADGAIQTGYTARQRAEIDSAFVGREDICPNSTNTFTISYLNSIQKHEYPRPFYVCDYQDGQLTYYMQRNKKGQFTGGLPCTPINQILVN